MDIVKFYQIFSRNNDKDGNPYRLVLLYNSSGTVVKVLQYRQSMIDTNVQMLYPTAKSLYGAVHLAAKEYKDMLYTFFDLLEEH